MFDSVDDMSVDGDMDSDVVDVVVGCLKDVGLLVFRDGSMFDCYEIVVVGLGGCPNLVLYLDGDCFFNLELGTRFYLGDPGVFDSFLVFYNDRVSFMRSVVGYVVGECLRGVGLKVIYCGVGDFLAVGDFFEFGLRFSVRDDCLILVNRGCEFCCCIVTGKQIGRAHV